MPKLLTDRMVRLDLERKLCRSSFYKFLQKFWPVIIPEKPVWNWHIKYLCDELQTVAERVFKGLPKEYDLVINVPPGTSKPVWEGTPVLMANGMYKKLKDVAKGDRVIGKSGKPCDVAAVHVQGELPCVRIVTNGGRFLIAAEDHPVLTADGWKLAGDIRPHDMVALMHRPMIVSEQESGRTDDDFRLAGYLIGDGSLAHNCCSLTSKDPEYIDDFVACVGRMGFSHTIRKDKTGLTRINLSKGKKQPRQWVRDVGLFNSTSRTKFVPDFVWKGSNEQVAVFLAAYFHCDGCVSYRHTGKRNLVVSMCSISKKLAVGVQRLLLRLGVPMRLRVRVARSGFSYNRGLKNYKYYVVETTDQDAAVRFLEKVPLIGRKKDKLEGFYPRRKTFDQSYWPDEVVSVEHIGSRACRCLTVDRDASFVANDIVVHNSTVVSIMFPVWCLVRMQSTRSIVATHTQTLGLELSRRSRMILKSEQFRQLFNIELEDDQDAKGFWVTKGGGSRFSCTVSGANPIGFHSHFLIVDDPIDPEKVLSKVSLQTAKQFMEETLPSRKIDNLVSVTILIMQRLAQDDPSANMLKEPNVRHICLPAEDGDNVSPPEVRKYYQNGLLDPVRLPQEVLNIKKKRPYYYSGQYGQCLIAGSKILTRRGEIAIENVTLSDEVLTRGGWKPVLWAGKTKEVDHLVGVLFANGCEVVGTPYHPVWVTTGVWKALESLGGGDYNASIYSPHLQGVFSWEGQETRTQNLYGSMEGSILNVGQKHISQDACLISDPRRNATNICTEMYGDIITETSPMVSISIMWTETLLTIRLKILNACLIESILCGILSDCERRSIESFCSKLLGKVMHGIGRKREENSIRNRADELSGSCGNLFPIEFVLVSSANVILNHVTIDLRRNIAQENVKKRTESEGIVRFVHGVTKSLSQVKVEHDAVLTNVGPTGGIPVYDITVKDSHEFFADGILVHNSPIPKGGGLFQVNRAFLVAPDGTPIPHSNHPPLITVVRFWDTALSAGKGAYTVGWKMGDDGQNFWILHVAREQKEPGERNRWIRQIAERDGKDVEQCIEQPSGFGKESAEATARALAGFRVRLEPVKSNKETRWDTFADQWNVGGVNMMQGEWNQDVIDEYEHCPFSTYKDQLDAGSDCFARLIAIREEKERKRKEEEFLKGILLTNNVPEAYKRKMENLKQNREIEADNSVSKIDMGNGEIVEIPWDE